MAHGAVLVGQELHLDVARALDVLLHVDVRAAERALRAGQGILQRGLERLRRAGDVDADASSALHRLQDDGESDGLRQLEGVVGVLYLRLHAGHDGRARQTHEAPGDALVAHEADGVRRGADEDDARLRAALGEGLVLGEEAIARMNGLDLGLFGDGQDSVHVQIAGSRQWRADVVGLVRQVRVKRLPIGVRIDRHRPDAHPLTGADDPAGYLPSVRNEYFGKHLLSLRRSRAGLQPRPAWPNKPRLSR